MNKSESAAQRAGRARSLRAPSRESGERPSAARSARAAVRPRAAASRVKAAAPTVAGGISDQAVRAATGKGWAAWFKVLKRFDVRTNGHKAAARHLHDAHACGDWWSQMIVVAYEQHTGLRRKHEKPDGYQISASKTVAAPVAPLFEAWSNPRLRRRWLPKAELVVRKATPHKSLRITWSADDTRVDVNFYPRSAERCAVSLNHGKLPSPRAASRMKSYWKSALDRLRRLLERSVDRPARATRRTGRGAEVAPPNRQLRVVNLDDPLPGVSGRRVGCAPGCEETGEPQSRQKNREVR